MNKLFLFGGVLLVLIGFAFYLSRSGEPTVQAPEESPVVVESIVETPVEPSAVRYPVPSIVEHGGTPEQPALPEPLPDLDDSDELIRIELGKLSDMEEMASLLLFNGLIRRFVVTIDNLPRQKIAQRFVFTQRPPGKFAVEQGDTEEEFVLDSSNFERYSRFIAFADLISDKSLLDIYTRYYPLFQQAYEDLGYPDAYFNDRLVEVLEHLSATPDIQQDIRLIRPNVFYQFADPELEALSAGQKLLLRMGYKHSVKLKSRFQALSRQLTGSEIR